MARLTARARMHAATSFYRPTLPAWENRAPSLRSRAPGDETLRSALLEALDLSQQRLCTTAGHDRLLGLLLGGGDCGAVEALTRALVGAIGHNNDRRVGPLCALAARTLTSWPSAALAAVRAARRAGVDAIVARLEHTVVDLTVHSCDILSELEDALRFEPRGPSARLHTVSDERFWGAIDERAPDDLASPRDGVGRLLVPVGRAGVLTGLPCPTCGDTFPAGRPRRCHACGCGLQVHCSEPCAAADLHHNCAENLRRARRLVEALHGSVAIVLLSETLALPVRAIDVLCDLTLPAWYPQLAAEDSVTLFQLHRLVLRQLRHREDAATDARRRLLVHGGLRPRPPRVS